MSLWSLAMRSLVRSPGRLVLSTLAVAFPVAVMGSTLLFVDQSTQQMTRQSLAPVQIDMRALATSLGTDMDGVRRRLEAVPGARTVDPFAAVDVVVGAPGASTRLSARLIAVEPGYFRHHPWVRAQGDLTSGALLNGGITGVPGYADAHQLSVELPGAGRPLGLRVPVAGGVDARAAAPTWFAIPAGDVQGDVAATPRVVVVDHSWFNRTLLPAMRHRFAGPSAVTNPGLSELPPASLEEHISVDTAAFPRDPAAAAAWSAAFRRVLERQAPGEILVADNAFEPLTEAAGDATGARLVFILVGIPGALVAAALALVAASAMAASHRQEEDVLRVRGAGDSQLATLTLQQSLATGGLGTAIGLLIAVGAVDLVTGTSVWSGVPAGHLIAIAAVTALLGSASTVARLMALLRSGKHPPSSGRTAVGAGDLPLWRRTRLDIVLVVVGVAILALNVAFGGIRLPLLDTDHQSQTLALAFFVLIAPLSLWLGLVLLCVRGWAALLTWRTRVDRHRPLVTWPRAVTRWLGRRPGRALGALTLGSLAVAFATMVLTFTATYDTAQTADTQAAFGADLRLEPVSDLPTPLPDLGNGVVQTTPVLLVPARAGSDRKTVAAIDPATYPGTVTRQPVLLRGRGVDGLAADRAGVVVSEEIERDFDLKVGDTLPVTVFPDDLDLSTKIDLHVVGVFRSFPPDDPFSEMVISTRAIPAPVPPPDTYLARTRSAPDPVAGALRASGVEQTFTVLTSQDYARQRQRSLTALSLGGLSRLETASGALIAALGVGVLGAFTILERRRESAVLQMIGATTRQRLWPAAVEGIVAATGSVVTGVPVGIALATVSVRVLGLFFTLPPPLVVVPVAQLALLTALVLAASALATALVLARLSRVDPAPLLREP